MDEHILQLRSAEERREQAEARARELEKQVTFVLFSYFKFVKPVWVG